MNENELNEKFEKIIQDWQIDFPVALCSDDIDDYYRDKVSKWVKNMPIKEMVNIIMCECIKNISDDLNPIRDRLEKLICSLNTVRSNNEHTRT